MSRFSGDSLFVEVVGGCAHRNGNYWVGPSVANELVTGKAGGSKRTVETKETQRKNGGLQDRVGGSVQCGIRTWK